MLNNNYNSWISAFNGAIAFIVYLPGIFVEFTEPPKKERPAIALGVPTALPAPSTGNVVMSASATNLEERAPPMPMAPVNKALRKVHNRELLKQFSRVSVIDPSDDLNVMKEEQQEQNLQTQQSTVSGWSMTNRLAMRMSSLTFTSQQGSTRSTTSPPSSPSMRSSPSS